MELHKLTSKDISGFDAARCRETEAEIRKTLANIRMDIYTAKSAHGGKIRNLRKSLARLLTFKTQLDKSAPKPAPKAKPEAKAKAPKAPKAAAAAKPAAAKTAEKASTKAKKTK